MRRHGLTDSPRDIGLNGHACWSYEGVDDDFLSAAATFLDEGRRLGQRLMFVGGADAEDDWREHAAWESYADRLMASRPLAALCCFDRTVLSDSALAAIGSAHPVTDDRLQDLVPFRLYGEVDAVALAGEVDVFSAELLDRLLRAGDQDTADLVLDVDGLTFIDHTGLRVIQRHARRVRQDGGKLVVRGESPVFRRLSDLLGAEF